MFLSLILPTKIIHKTEVGVHLPNSEFYLNIRTKQTNKYIYICTYECMCVRTQARTHARTNARTHVFMDVCMYVRRYVYIVYLGRGENSNIQRTTFSRTVQILKVENSCLGFIWTVHHQYMLSALPSPHPTSISALQHFQVCSN